MSKIVGFISEDEQITAIQELKKTFPNKDSAIKFVSRNSSLILLYSYGKKIGKWVHIYKILAVQR